jgi:hypothetical protein
LLGHSRPAEFTSETRIGLTSEVLNGFFGAAYGAYIGILMIRVNDLFLAGILFVLLMTNILGATTALNQEVPRAAIALMAVWGLNAEVIRAFSDLTSLAVLGGLLSSAWMCLLFPPILKSLGGRP